MTRLDDLLFGDGTFGDADPVVHMPDRSTTAAELRRRASDLTGALLAAGVEPGTPVAVMLDNGPDLVATLFAVWRARAAYVPVNPRLTDDEVAHIRAQIEPGAVVTTSDRRDRLPGLPAVITDGDDPTIVPAATQGRRLDPDVALVQFTSGTTGRPKPVLLLHSGVLPLIDNVLTKLKGAPKPDAPKKAPMPNLVPLSLSLWAGIYQVLFAYRAGAPIVIMPSFDTADFAALVSRFGIRSTVLPPAALVMLADDEALATLEPLKFVRSITAPLSVLQAKRFRDRFGIAVLNSYGQTEIGGEIVGWSAADSREFGETKLGSVGRPHHGVSIRADADDGELQVMTPTLSAGYADGNDLSDRLTADGWFRTGDVGRVDDEGFVWIEGRVSDMINRGGLKVFPGEVEEAVRLHPGVADAAVVGVPDDRLGEVPWAFVVTNAPVDEAAVQETCRAHVAPYKVPVRVVEIDELPRNEVGKVLARTLVERALA